MRTPHRISLLLLTLHLTPATALEDKNQTHRIDQLEIKSLQTNMEIEGIRRDQLNYKIEKDLLKEAYSSNLNTINIVITMILGFITVIGFLGTKGISSIKKDFQKELTDLIQLKKSLEEQIAEISTQLNSAKEGIEKIREENETQEKRLKLLEIQEKAGNFISQKNYKRALEYISVGLGLSDTDPVLLSQKSTCLYRSGQLTEAAINIEKALSIDPNDITNICNLIEIYFLTEQTQKGLKMLEDKSNILEDSHGPYLKWYLLALSAFLSGNESDLKNALAKQPMSSPQEVASRINRWSYSEALSVIEKMKSRPGYTLMKNTISFLEGKTSLPEFTAAIK